MQDSENHFIELLKDADVNHAKAILDILEENNINEEYFVSFFSKIKIDIQLDLLDNWPYSTDLLYNIINCSKDGLVINKIVDTYNIELNSPKIDIEQFFSKVKKINLENQELNKKGNKDNVISLPSRMITLALAKKIWAENDVMTARYIISDSSYCTTSTLLNDYVKARELEFIDNYNEIRESIRQFANSESGERKKAKDKVVELLYQCHNTRNIYMLESTSFYMSGEKMFSRFLKEYIIDYLFEIPYANDEVLNEVKELLTFSRNGHIELSPEKDAFYEAILNISELDDNEAISLFNKYKSNNVLEMFYDDIKKAEHIRNLDIKEKCLTQEQMKEMINEELSEKFGITVYTPNDKPFIALEKTVDTGKDLDELPTGHSFSVISNKNPDDTYFYSGARFIYDASIINPNQIVHVFQTDSYTEFHPFQGTEKASDKINTLMDANELIENTDYYNEVLILEQGSDSTDMDKDIPSMKKMALYCVNEITEKDIERAKKEGVGIFLAYDKNKNLGTIVSK